MSTMTLVVKSAPSTPLNLQFGTVYAPRVVAPPFVGFDCIEVAPLSYIVRGYTEIGEQQELYRGPLMQAFSRFASHLRMDVAL